METFYFDQCDSQHVAVAKDAVFKDGKIPSSNGKKCHCFSVKKEGNYSFLKKRDCNANLHFICELSMFNKSKSFCLRKFLLTAFKIKVNI